MTPTKKQMYLITLMAILVCSVYTKTKDEWKTRTIYQVMTDRMGRTNGDTSGCDLSNYCGGTFKGIQNNLDYIQTLGFDAIWISPIVKNTPGGYHGYWAQDLYQLNEHFGTPDDFKNLVYECHQRNIWVMVDVVANHMAPVGTDYGQLNPFNRPEHFHDICDINQDDFTHNQWRVEVNLLFFINYLII
jgi:alpha-amylase